MKNTNMLYKENYLIELINSKHFPFLKNTYLTDLDDKSIDESVKEKAQNTSLELSSYPKFKNVSYENIIQLRIMLYLGLDDLKLDSWCSKILRYVEINLPKLKKNEKQYNRTSEDSILIFQQIKALFVEHYIKNHDLIYFNSALKIADLNWINPTSKTPSSIKELNTFKNRQIEHILKQLTSE